jgi:hypothetical protein
MAWLRRFNENNVDLNRNFRYPGDFVRRHVPYWDIVDKFLNPASPPQAERFALRAAWFLLRHWRPSLRQTVAGGQYFNPKGLFYGGKTMEEGPAKFQEWMQERLADAERIVVIDVHTGLGRFGEDRLLVDPAPEKHDDYQTMQAVFGKRIEAMDKSGVAYAVQGSQQNMYLRLFPRAEVFFVAQEFGTYSPLRVIKALREENRWHFYGNRSRHRHPADMELLEVFNPKDAAWRFAVLSRGRDVIHQACTLAFGDPQNQL